MKKEQWKETFSDAVNEIEDKYVQESRQGGTAGRFSGRRLVMGLAIGLAAAAAVVFAVIAGPKLLKKEPEAIVSAGPKDPQEGVSMEPCVLVKAEYPERIQTTENYNDKAWEKKFEETRMRRELAASYKGKLTDFSKTSVQALLSDADTNPVGSPANFYLALAMLAEASEGETRQEALRVLGVGSIEELREITKAYWNANFNEGLYETCRLASSVWMNQGLPYRENKLETFRDQYYASVFQGQMGDAAYDTALRDWINDQTGELLSDSIRNLSMDPRGVMDLVTTVYYKAVWGTPFNPEKTVEDTFHGKASDSTVSFMRDDGNMKAYYSGERFGAVSLSVGDQGEMLFFLPDEGVDVRTLASDEEVLSLMIDDSETRYEKWDERTAFPIIHLWLPKFDVSAENDLTECMKSIGIEKAFSADDADFSGILDTDDPVFLSKVQNNVRLAIDENGVTAASMINMMLAGAGMPEDEIDFRLDRPFLFALRSDMGDLLFVGIIEQI